jgi:hypothetical protein
MNQNNIPDNLPSVERLIQRTRAAERSNQKEIRISLLEAKELTEDLAVFTSRLGKTIADIQSSLREIRNTMVNIDVSMDGGSL